MIKADRLLGMRLVRRIVVGVLLFTGTGQAMAEVGRTPGIFDVSSTGAAAYTIALWTPQGPNGMQPNLALTYDSGGANGVLGVGWTLSGLSSIERCQTSRGADAGFTGGYDRFCLNGNKLRLDDPGSAYGAPGTTYRTELHSFAAITAYGGSAATGPDYFIMVGNDARTYEFGLTADSRVIVGTQVLRWKLNKVSDTAGNAYLISYSSETGFAVPTAISWTATAAGQSTYRHLAQFNYSTTRTDALSAKFSSQTLANNRRLDSIEVKSS
ncbi:MAG: SpvB/TcaC N-terminal domain-containing protein, partial [Steroidobacteraceae bacterium]